MQDINTIKDVLDVVNRAIVIRSKDSLDSLILAAKAIESWESPVEADDNLDCRKEAIALIDNTYFIIHRHERVLAKVLEQTEKIKEELK